MKEGALELKSRGLSSAITKERANKRLGKNYNIATRFGDCPCSAPVFMRSHSKGMLSLASRSSRDLPRSVPSSRPLNGEP